MGRRRLRAPRILGQALMRRRRGRSQGVDMTPLIDVLFMLVIFFAVTAEFAQRAITVDLPSGTQPLTGERESIVITVERDGALLWDGAAISRDALIRRATETVGSGGSIAIAGDREADYGVVAELLDELRLAGAGEATLLFDRR